MQYVDLPRTSRLDAHNVGTDDPWWICAWKITSSSSRRVPVFLSPTAKAFTMQYTKEGAAPASTDKRLAIELAKVMAKEVSGETDLRWIDARYQNADCLTKHASRKSEAVLQKILHEAQWIITAEEDTLDRRKREREIRNNSSYDEELWLTNEWPDGETSCRQENFEQCESGCAYNGITDAVTNLLMKVQHVAVSENSVYDSCVPCAVIWTWKLLHSLGKRDGICSVAWGYTSLVSTPSELWTLEMCQSQITLLPKYGVIAWLLSCDSDMRLWTV